MIEKPILGSEYPQEYIEFSKDLLNSTVALFGTNKSAYNLAGNVSEKYPWACELAFEESRKTDCTSLNIMLSNLSYDLLMGTMGCSTIVKQTSYGPMIARNMDWFPASKIAKASAIIPTKNGLHAAAPGLFGVVTGLSNNGFALVLNAAFGESNQWECIPMLLFLRQVLDEASDFHDALKKVSTTPLMSGGLITIVGKTNDQICVVERTPTKSEVRFPQGKEPLIVTNHYRKLHKPNETCDRYNFLVKNSNKPLTDLLEYVTQDITSQHIFIYTAENSIKLFVPEQLLSEEEEDVSLEDLFYLLKDQDYE